MKTLEANSSIQTLWNVCTMMNKLIIQSCCQILNHDPLVRSAFQPNTSLTLMEQSKWVCVTSSYIAKCHVNWAPEWTWQVNLKATFRSHTVWWSAVKCVWLDGEGWTWWESCRSILQGPGILNTRTKNGRRHSIWDLVSHHVPYMHMWIYRIKD